MNSHGRECSVHLVLLGRLGSTRLGRHVLSFARRRLALALLPQRSLMVRRQLQRVDARRLLSERVARHEREVGLCVQNVPISRIMRRARTKPSTERRMRASTWSPLWRDARTERLGLG